MAVVLLTIVAIACKRDFPVYEPEPNPAFEPIIKTTPALFKDRPLNIMSEYEQKNKLPFRGHILAKLGSGKVGGALHTGWEALSTIGEVLWEAYDYHKTECNFKEVMDQLNGIQNQLETIDGDIKNSLDVFNLKIEEFKEFFQSQELGKQFDAVDVAMDSTLMDGLLHMVNIAKAYQADTGNIVKKANMQALQTRLPKIAAIKILGKGDGSMPYAIQQMNSMICPATDDGTNALKSYANTVIQKCQGQVNDTTSAMNAYLLLEGYFLKVVNYQLQAAIVYANYCNVLDPSGNSASDFLTGNVTRIIPSEVRQFLNAVDYLAVNLTEYRKDSQYLHDMQYAGYGIAPDIIFHHVYARSQFLANLIYGISNAKYSIINGHIIVPNRYNPDGNGTTDYPNPLSVKIGSETALSSDTIFKSQIPYTYWQKGVSYPDNHWNSYRLRSAVNSSDWSTSPITIEILAKDSITPWFHTAKSLHGSITALYYNPSDTRQHSTTKTESCYFQFGYFTGSWYWGHLDLINNNCKLAGPKSPNNIFPDCYFDLHHYDDRYPNKTTWEAGIAAPNSFDSNLGSNPKYYQYADFYSIFPSYINFSFLAGKMVANGKIGINQGFYFGDENACIVDSRVSLSQVGSRLISTAKPDKGNKNSQNTVEAWGSYSGFINGWSGKSPHLIISVGTHDHSEGKYLYQVGDLVYDEYKNFASPLHFQQKFARKQLEFNNYYNPGFQYFYTTSLNRNYNVDGEISLDFNEQFIYTGLYNLSN
jgi:hypothetical protein